MLSAEKCPTFCIIQLFIILSTKGRHMNPAKHITRTEKNSCMRTDVTHHKFEMQIEYLNRHALLMSESAFPLSSTSARKHFFFKQSGSNPVINSVIMDVNTALTSKHSACPHGMTQAYNTACVVFDQVVN